MVCIAAVEDVEGTVIHSRFEVVQVILHFHLHTVAIVVLATFEFLIAIFFSQSLQRPFASCVPIVLNTKDDHWLVWGLIFFNELLWGDIFDVNPLHLIVDMFPSKIKLIQVVVGNPVFRSTQFWSGTLFGLPDPLSRAVGDALDIDIAHLVSKNKVKIRANTRLNSLSNTNTSRLQKEKHERK